MTRFGLSGLLTTMTTMMSLMSLERCEGFILKEAEIRDFLTSYCNVLKVNNVNIFLPNSDPTEADYALTPGVLRNLWVGNTRSLALRRVGSVREVIEALVEERYRSLNVWFLHSPQDLLLFIQSPDQSLIRDHLWLMFGNIRDILANLDRPYLILDNKINFALVSNTSKSVQILEAYNVGPNVAPTIKQLGSWSEGQPVSISSRTWIERRSNLTGLHLRCTTLEQLPFTVLSPPDEELNVQLLGGYAVDVWHTLRDQLGFTYSCRQPADDLWGSQTNGVWNGLVKDILDDKADVVVTSLDQDSTRREVIDFTLGIKEVGYQLVVRRPKLMEQTWTSFTSELVPASWMATIAFAILVPPCLTVCSRFSPLETEKISFKDAYILTIGAMTTQGSWLDVRSTSTRIVFITIFLATLLVYAHYTSALVSLLTVASTTTRFSSLQDLLDDKSYSFGFRKGISLQEEFEGAKSGLFHDIWHELTINDPANLPNTNAEGVQRVIDTFYVFMLEENIYNSKFYNVCETTLVKGKYFSKQTGFALAKGSPLRQIFNAQIMRMRDGGILNRLWELWQPPSALCTSEGIVALDIYQLFTAFLLLLLGIGLGVVFLPIERLHWNMISKNKAFRTISKTPPKINVKPPSSDSSKHSNVTTAW